MLCISLNHLAIKIELDAKVVLGQVTKEFNSNLHHVSFIMDCRTLINEIPQVRMELYFHEANKCANALARDSSHYFMLFDSLPMDLCMLLFYDNYGLYYEKL